MKSGLGRRRFLAAGGSAMLAGVFGGCGSQESGGPSSEAQPASQSVPPNFKIGFQSYSLRHFTDRQGFLEQATLLGLPYVELYRGHLATDASVDQIAEMKNQVESIAVNINAFGVEAFTADHEKNQALFQFGKSLGVDNLSADPTKDAFESLSQLVAQYDIRIAIHNHGPEDERWQRPEWTLEVVRDLDPRIGACVDTGHFIRAGVDPVEAIEMLGSRVLGVHMKDFNRELEETILGDGQLDLPGTLAALKRVEFEGPMSLEYEEDPENPVPAILESARRIREWEAGA